MKNCTIEWLSSRWGALFFGNTSFQYREKPTNICVIGQIEYSRARRYGENTAQRIAHQKLAAASAARNKNPVPLLK